MLSGKFVIEMYQYRSNFVITASCDGHVKFWKKQEELIEFVKHFRAHLMPIQSMSTSCNGVHMCSVSIDKSMKIFDVINFGKYKNLLFLFKMFIKNI